MVKILPIETPTLGDRSYLVHDGTAALVIDPQRDIDRVTALAADAGVRITHVAETHMHNDYVTGGLALARVSGARYLVCADDPVSFDRTPVSDGDRVETGGGMTVRVLATPGHTFSHLAYVVESGGAVAGVFTGGSLLYGSTGRTDLLGPDAAAALTLVPFLVLMLVGALLERLGLDAPGTTVGRLVGLLPQVPWRGLLHGPTPGGYVALKLLVAYAPTTILLAWLTVRLLWRRNDLKPLQET